MLAYEKAYIFLKSIGHYNEEDIIRLAKLLGENTGKTRVDIEDIKYITSKRLEINMLDLRDIVFYENGKPVEISKKAIDDFMFTGLSNIDFITSEFYLGNGSITENDTSDT